MDDWTVYISIVRNEKALNMQHIKVSINITCISDQRKSQRLNFHVKAASQIQANTAR